MSVEELLLPAENSERTAKPRGRPFRPGQSGNPGGRPKVLAEVRDLARASTLEALETIRHLMADEKIPPAIRLSAAEALLDRAWGKSATVQPSDLNRPAWRELPQEVLDQLARYRCSRGHRVDGFLVEEKAGGRLRVACHCGSGVLEIADDAIILGSDVTGPW
jgi:hypothetical protein